MIAASIPLVSRLLVMGIAAHAETFLQGHR